MRFQLLNISGIHTPVAKVFKSKRGKQYFNLKHGYDRGNNISYTFNFSHRDFKPENLKDELILDKDNYLIIPIIKDGKEVLDKHGNKKYCVFLDNNKSHVNDIILMWEVPNRNYFDIKYIIEGDVELIADASFSIDRVNTTNKTPMPVLNIHGNTKLSWEAKSYSKRFTCPFGGNGDSYLTTIKQDIFYEYDKDKWTINDVKTNTIKE